MALAAALLLTTTTGAFAQAGGMPGGMQGQRPGGMSGMVGQRGMMGQQGMMGMMGMMAAGRPSPAMILRMGQTLDLTEEQATQLRQIQQKYSGTVRQQMQDAMSARRSAATALSKDTPDFDAYRKAHTEAGRNMVAAHVAMAHAAVDAEGILTSEQRQELHTGMRVLQDMMGGPGMMGSGMMHGGGAMMQGSGGMMQGGDRPPR